MNEVISSDKVDEVVNHIKKQQNDFFDCSSILSYIERLNDCLELLKNNYNTENGKKVYNQILTLVQNLNQIKIYEAINQIKSINILVGTTYEKTKCNG